MNNKIHSSSPHHSGNSKHLISSMTGTRDNVKYIFLLCHHIKILFYDCEPFENLEPEKIPGV